MSEAPSRYTVFLTAEGAQTMRHLDAFLRVTTDGRLVLDCLDLDVGGAMVAARATSSAPGLAEAGVTVELLFPHRFVELAVRGDPSTPPGFVQG